MDEWLDLDNILMKFTHIVNRRADIKWGLDDVNKKSNFILVYDGEVYVEADGEAHIAKAGDLIYFKRGVKRLAYTFAENPLKCYAISCDLSQYDEVTKRMVTIDMAMPFVQAINGPIVYQKLVKYFKEMVDHWQSKDPYQNYELKSRFLLIVKTLIEWQGRDSYNYEQNNKVSKIIDYMTQHMDQSISIQEISQSLESSVSYISRIFKQTMGVSMVTYFNQLKIEKSKDYLATGYSVGECAHLLAFSDLYYFSKVFKQYEGIAPSVYAKTIV